MGVIEARQRVAEGPEHSGEGPGGVDGEEDIVQDDEDLEPAGLAKRVWFVSATLVHAIEQHDGDGVDGGNGNGDTDIEKLVEELGRDVEWLVPGGFCELWCRKSRGELVGRKFQHGGMRKTNAHGGRARRGDQVVVEHGVSSSGRGIELVERNRGEKEEEEKEGGGIL